MKQTQRKGQWLLNEISKRHNISHQYSVDADRVINIILFNMSNSEFEDIMYDYSNPKGATS